MTSKAGKRREEEGEGGRGGGGRGGGRGETRDLQISTGVAAISLHHLIVVQPLVLVEAPWRSEGGETAIDTPHKQQQ